MYEVVERFVLLSRRWKQMRWKIGTSPIKQNIMTLETLTRLYLNITDNYFSAVRIKVLSFRGEF